MSYETNPLRDDSTAQRSNARDLGKTKTGQISSADFQALLCKLSKYADTQYVFHQKGLTVTIGTRAAT